MAALENSRICLGCIADAQGVRGAVRIQTFTETPEDIAAYGVLEDKAGARSFEIVTVRRHKGTVVIATLAGIDDRTAAEALKGTELYVGRDCLPEQDEDDVWYYADLVGLTAIEQDKTVLGEVVAVQNFGSGDLLEVRLTDSSKTVLIPFTEAVVPTVDIAAGKVLIVPPEG
ncbi:MAG: ribosome maturation factor RimM, partial [Methyloligellaceae bacterium]